MGKQSISLIIIFLLLSTLSHTVHAHPGSALTSGFTEGFIHPWLGIDHVLVMIAIGIWTGLSDKQHLMCLPVVFLIAMMAGSLIHSMGIIVNFAEIMVALSVFAIGIILLLNQQSSERLTASLVILFALCHGYVHGAEISTESDFISYTMGFALATIVLQSIGILTGLAGPSLQIKLKPATLGYALLQVQSC